MDLLLDNLFSCFTFLPTQHTVSFEMLSPIYCLGMVGGGGRMEVE